jgi:hypothetical protein
MSTDLDPKLRVSGPDPTKNFKCLWVQVRIHNTDIDCTQVLRIRIRSDPGSHPRFNLIDLKGIVSRDFGTLF